MKSRQKDKGRQSPARPRGDATGELAAGGGDAFRALRRRARSCRRRLASLPPAAAVAAPA